MKAFFVTSYCYCHHNYPRRYYIIINKVITISIAIVIDVVILVVIFIAIIITVFVCFLLSINLLLFCIFPQYTNPSS